jgi:hypothetical protein
MTNNKNDSIPEYFKNLMRNNKKLNDRDFNIFKEKKNELDNEEDDEYKDREDELDEYEEIKK